jgi:hypothetical protein
VGPADATPAPPEEAASPEPHSEAGSHAVAKAAVEAPEEEPGDTPAPMPPGEDLVLVEERVQLHVGMAPYQEEPEQPEEEDLGRDRSQEVRASPPPLHPAGLS